MQKRTVIKRPWCIVSSACSLDGRTSPKPHTSSMVFVPMTPKRFTRMRMDLRKKVDAIMVGSDTILIDNSRLVRRNQNPGILRVVVDSQGRITPGYNVLDDEYRTLVLVTKNTPERYKRLVSGISNKSYLECGDEKVDLALAFRKLYGMGVRKILVEGGGTLVYQLISRRLVDEMKIVYLPTFIGARESSSLVSGQGSIFDSAKLRIKHHELVNGFLYVEGTLEYKR